MYILYIYIINFFFAPRTSEDYYIMVIVHALSLLDANKSQFAIIVTVYSLKSIAQVEDNIQWYTSV